MQARILTGQSLSDIFEQLMQDRQLTDLAIADKLAMLSTGDQPDSVKAICNLLGAAVLTGFASRAENRTLADVLAMLQGALIIATEEIATQLHGAYHDTEAPDIVKANPLAGTRLGSLIRGMTAKGDQLAPLPHDELVAFVKGPLDEASKAQEAIAEAALAEVAKQDKAMAEAQRKVKH